MNPVHSSEIDFAGLDLTGRTTYYADGVAADWYRYEAQPDADPGNPDADTTERASALFDGAAAELVKWGNRLQSWPLRIVAANSRGLAAGERELGSLMGDTPRVFGWTPPDGWGERTEFDVMVSHLEYHFADLEERRPNTFGRHYTLHLICAPFGYAAEEVTDVLTFDAPGADPATQVISDGTSATNWTGVEVDAGSLKMTNLTGAGGWGGGTWVAHWNAASPIDPTAYGYLSITLRTSNPAADLGTVTGYYDDDSMAFTAPIEVTPASGDPSTKTYVYKLAALPGAATGLSRIVFNVNAGAGYDAWIDDVHLTEPTAQSPVGHIFLSGSAPVTGTIMASVATGGFDDLLLYTSPCLLEGGYQPHVKKGSGVALLTGSVAASTLPPGSYAVLVNVPAMSVNHQITAEFTMGGQSVTIETPLLDDTQPAGIYPVGIVTLPPADVPQRRTGLDVSFTVTLTSGFARDLWLFHLGDGAALTHVAPGDSPLRVFVQDPVLGDLTPGIFTGSQDDMSDAAFPGVDAVRAWGKHRLFPPFAPVYFYGADEISVTHRPAFHHFAAAPRSS